MSTTVTTGESIHRPRRLAVVSAAVVAALALGAGAAAMRLTSSDSSPSRVTAPATVLATNVDVQALWNQLSTMPVNERNNIVAGLSPDLRARLRSAAEEIATSAEHH